MDTKETAILLVGFGAPERPEDIAELKGLIEKHQRLTGSSAASRILDRWDGSLPKFVKVMPVDYKRVLEENKAKAGAGA